MPSRRMVREVPARRSARATRRPISARSPTRRSRARAGSRGAAPGAPGPPRTSGRPRRRGPSSSSRTARGSPRPRRPDRCAQVHEAHHHVGELHAGVVDVVLHLDRLAQGAQGPRQHVAQHGVAQVADVRRLVGVDVGVLDDDLATAGLSGSGTSRPRATGRRAPPGRGRRSGNRRPRPAPRAPPARRSAWRRSLERSPEAFVSTTWPDAGRPETRGRRAPAGAGSRPRARARHRKGPGWCSPERAPVRASGVAAWRRECSKGSWADSSKP